MSKIKLASANPYDEGESLDDISQSFELSQSEEPESIAKHEPVNKGPSSLAGLPKLKISNVQPLAPINSRKTEVEQVATNSKNKLYSADPYDEGESIDVVSESFELSQTDEPEPLTTFAYSSTAAKLAPVVEPKSFVKDLPKVAAVATTSKQPAPTVTIPSSQKSSDDEYDDDIEEEIEEELDDFEVDNGDEDDETHFRSPVNKNPYQNDRIINNESELSSFDYIERRI